MAIKNNNARQSDDPAPSDYDDVARPSEVSAFKKGLAGINLDILRERLSSSTISKKWKRDLVEAEFNRRMAGMDADVNDDAASELGPMRTVNWGRWTASAIIGGCVLILLYTAFEFWQM